MTPTHRPPRPPPYDGRVLAEGRVTVRVLYAATDQMGVVYHSRFFEWFEAGRNELLRDLGLPYTAFEAQGVYLPVIELFTRYHRPARYDQVLTVVTRLHEMPTASIRLDYEIIDHDTDDLLVTGYTIHGFLTAAGRPTRVPSWLRQRLLAHSAP